MKRRKILVIDIGGTHVKLLATGHKQPVLIPSGPELTPRKMVTAVRKALIGWKYDVVSIGYPGPVLHGHPVSEPHHLGRGWIGFDFRRAFHRPVKIINDAAMQALGSYRGGRMLFLGLGTGLGSALVWEKNLMPLELGDLPYEGRVIEKYLGKIGFDRLGKKEWMRHVLFCLKYLKLSFIADYIVLGGGLVKEFDSLPDGVEPGDNKNSYLGGLRMWETDAKTRRPKWNVM